MIEKAIIISLQITAIYILFQQGNLLGNVRIGIANWLDKKFTKQYSILIQKPLFECLCCMSSVWTILITFTIDIGLMLLVCGINCIIYKICFSDETGIRE